MKFFQSFIICAGLLTGILGCKKKCPEAILNVSGSGQVAPATVSFESVPDLDADYDITYIKWDFGDGNVVNNENSPTHLYTSSGEYTVKLTVGTNGGKCDNSTVSQKVIILSPQPVVEPAPSFIHNVVTNISPFTVNFTNTSTNATSYQWEFGDGSGTSTQTNPSYVYNNVGTYTVKLTATGNGISKSTTSEIILTNAPQVNAGFTLSAPNFTAPCTVQFTNTSTNANSYLWNFGHNNQTSTQTNPSYTYPNAGNYTVTLTANGVGGPKTATQTINIANPPLPVANFSFSNNGCPAPCGISFNNNSTNATTYEWNFGDGSQVSTQSNPTHTYNTSGFFTVTLIARNASGQSSQPFTQQIQISQTSPTGVWLDDIMLNTVNTTCGWDNLPDYSFKIFEWNGTSWIEIVDGPTFDDQFLPVTWYCDSNECVWLSTQKSYLIEFYISDFSDCATGTTSVIDISPYTGSQPSSLDVSYGVTSVTIYLNW